ncbi:MAG: hypothetical protein ACTSQJ_05875 [Promethearchaeota archaeon]
MEHKILSLDYDKSLINKVLDDIDMKYIILFLYVIRNDLFNDLSDENILNSYEKVLILDEIFKSNVINLLPENFIEVAIDLGLFKNIRSLREFKQKENDFILKMGEETITIEEKTILVPADILFLMINKKFKIIKRRNFNLALKHLKGIRCEVSGVIHPFIFQIGENDYTIADDLYYILDQYGNIYQAIKIEVTIEGFYRRFNEIFKKINEFIEIFDPILNSKTAIKKINKAIEENKNILKYLKNEKIKLSDKFEVEKIDKSAQIYQDWLSKLLQLLKFRYKMEKINQKLLNLKSYYSGKKKNILI